LETYPTTGNSITGGFGRSVTETDNTTLIESGNNAAGSFSLTETTSQQPTIVETGNSVTGDYTLIETGAQAYTLDETNVGVPPSGGLTPYYTLHETGSSPTTLTQTGSTITGDYTQTITGTDSYTLAESGAFTNAAGNHTYTETLTATDTSTVNETGNSLNGIFQRTVTGAIAGAMIETGDDNGVGYVRPTDISTGYTVTDTGNYVDGSISLTETGTDRYALLEQFNNTSNANSPPLSGGGQGGGISNGPGNVDYSPTGAPFSIGQGPAVPTSGTAYPGEQSPAAEQQDPFAAQGLELLHEYCFPREVEVDSSSGVACSIADIRLGAVLRGPIDSDAEGPVGEGVVDGCFANGIKPVMRVYWGGGMTPVTPNHPWLVKGGGWVASAKLKSGDLLRAFKADEESWLPVERTEDLGETAEVFNVRVSGTHTYTAGNGVGWFAVVHNESEGPNLAAVMKTLQTYDPAVAEFLKTHDLRPEMRGNGFWENFAVPNYTWAKSTDASGKQYGAFRVSASASNYEVLSWFTESIRKSPTFEKWAQANGWAEPAQTSGISPAPGTIEHLQGQTEMANRAWDANIERMKQGGATDSEISAVSRAYWGNAILGPRGYAETIVTAASPLAARAAVKFNNGASTAQTQMDAEWAAKYGRTPNTVPPPKVAPAPQPERQKPNQLPPVENEVPKKPPLPPAVADARGVPRYNPNVSAHVHAAVAEEQLANDVHNLPDQVVVRWGDPIGANGADVISVNQKTGEVTLWDGKFRSRNQRIQPSPTFEPGSETLKNAIKEAVTTIENNQTLPANIRKAALRNLELDKVTTRTVGFGNAKNSTLQ